VIFCLPVERVSRRFVAKRGVLCLTVSAGLDGSFNVADALDGDAVLVVAVDELVLELTDLVNEHTELVGDIGNVVIESLAPDGKLLLGLALVVFSSA
jgi:hypothetical protein